MNKPRTTASLLSNEKPSGRPARPAKQETGRRQNAAPRRQTMFDRTSYHSLHNWRRDGEDHINVALQGMTQLGRSLSPSYHVKIEHPVLGNFSCMRGLILWLEMREHPHSDELRQASGPKLQKVQYRLVGDMRQKYGHKWHPIMPKNGYAIIADVLFNLLDSTPALRNQLQTLDVPLDIYHVDENTGLRTHFVGDSMHWYVNMLEQAVMTLKQHDRLPNPLGYCEIAVGSTDDLYEAMIPEYQRVFLREKAEAQRLKLEQEERRLIEEEQRQKAAVEQTPAQPLGSLAADFDGTVDPSFAECVAPSAGTAKWCEDSDVIVMNATYGQRQIVESKSDCGQQWPAKPEQAISTPGVFLGVPVDTTLTQQQIADFQANYQGVTTTVNAMNHGFAATPLPVIDSASEFLQAEQDRVIGDNNPAD